MKVNKCFVGIFGNISNKLRNTQVYLNIPASQDKLKNTHTMQFGTLKPAKSKSIREV